MYDSETTLQDDCVTDSSDYIYNIAVLYRSRVDKSKSVELLVTALAENVSSLIVIRSNNYYNVMLAPLTRNHTC